MFVGHDFVKAEVEYRRAKLKQSYGRRSREATSGTGWFGRLLEKARDRRSTPPTELVAIDCCDDTDPSIAA